MKYALLTYSTTNLGDDIQSLAAAQFLPRVDTLLDRDHLDEYGAGIPTALICNGWWAHRPTTWPPPPEVRPFLISMHIRQHGPSLERFTSPDLRRFYERHGPVGCRDEYTLQRLQSAGVPAYFSGCLTLTFPRYDGPRSNRIVFADPFGPGDFSRTCAHVGDQWWRSVPEVIRRDAIIVTHHVETSCSKHQRLARARALLDTYRQARLVITNRLHAALPCVAMGTPVVLIEPRYEPSRLSGLDHLFSMHNRADAVAGRWDIDWCDPRTRSVDIEPLRRDLIERCTRYVNTFTEEHATCSTSPQPQTAATGSTCPRC
ncbi:polysaccharide pyruvyl transferase family protein [Planctomycetales bacterium ZRK34]|nr:polysaccharide pyruvyl transferase family protein [Planctomycetales bacterium ZRK34]